MTSKDSKTWAKYKRRIYIAKMSVENLRNQIIMIRSRKMDVVRAVEMTNNEANKILSMVGVFATNGGELVTRRDWERDGWRHVEYVTNIPLYKEWKQIIKGE